MQSKYRNKREKSLNKMAFSIFPLQTKNSPCIIKLDITFLSSNEVVV